MTSKFKPTKIEKSLSRWTVIQRVMGWARGEYFPTAPPLSTFSRFFRELTRILEYQGVPGGIAWMRRRRHQYLKYLESEPGSPEEKKFRTKLGRYMGRRAAAVLLEKRPPVIRIVLTALTALRAFRLPVKVDLSPITSPATVVLQPQSYAQYIQPFWKKITRRRKGVKPSDWSNCHFTQKAGPNGPALTTAFSDLLGISVYPDLIRDIGTVGGKTLHDFMGRLLAEAPTLSEPSSKFFEPKSKFIRKVVGIPDKEGKTRAIAILDYWSQEALRGLHSFLFQILRGINQDMTFAQGAFKEKVLSWGENVILHSVDLTAATDRFPIDLIADILAWQCGVEYSAAWKRIMVDYPFSVSPRNSVSYAVGNPMGAQSSWSSFTVAHHFVMYWCCRELKISWETAKYVILGDDVLIGDSNLAACYRTKLDLIGVQVSLAKTYTSSQICEFAKRYLFRGEEVSPFPVSSVLDHIGEASLLVAVLTGERRKSLEPKSGIPVAIENLSLAVGKSYRQSRRMRQFAAEALLTTEFLQGSMEAGTYVLRLNHPLDDSSADFLQAHNLVIINESCRRIVLDSLLKQDVGLAPLLTKEWFKAFDRFRGAPITRLTVLNDLPVAQVAVRFSQVLERFTLEGFRALRSGESLDPTALSDYLESPLGGRTWRLDKRKREIRGWSRFARTLVKVAREALKAYGIGTPWKPEGPAFEFPKNIRLEWAAVSGKTRPLKNPFPKFSHKSQPKNTVPRGPRL